MTDSEIIQQMETYFKRHITICDTVLKDCPEDKAMGFRTHTVNKRRYYRNALNYLRTLRETSNNTVRHSGG